MKTRYKIPLIVGIIIVISMISFIAIILFTTIHGMPQEGYCSETNKNSFCAEKSIFQDFRDEFDNNQSQLNDDIFFQDASLNSKLLRSNGEDHLIIYEITNGELINMWFSDEINSLNLNLDTTSDGVMSLIIPRELFDYPKDTQGHIVTIIQNRGEITGVDTSNDQNHIIHFNYTHPYPKIEIVGIFFP